MRLASIVYLWHKRAETALDRLKGRQHQRQIKLGEAYLEEFQ